MSWYLAATALNFFLFLACAWHARRTAPRNLWILLAAFVYGLILEQLVIWTFEDYFYPLASWQPFTLFEVPLAIGLGWAVIFYSAFFFTERFKLSLPAQASFAALLALNIDLVLDAVAIQVPFWVWTPPGPWFGVPLSNFFGWFWVIALFTVSLHFLEKKLPLFPWLSAFLAVPLSVVALIAILFLRKILTGSPAEFWRMSFLLLAVLLVALWLAFRELRKNPAPSFTSLDRVFFLVPLALHVFFLSLLLFLNLQVKYPLLLVLSLALFGISIWVHAKQEGMLPLKNALPRHA